MNRLLVCLNLCAFGCIAHAPPPPAPQPLAHLPSLDGTPEQDEPDSLTIIGTADLHGHLERLPMLAGYVETLRADRTVLLIDAGDMWQGTLASNLGEGAAVVRAYNAMGYDAAAVGNHEFDYGPVGPNATLREGDTQGDRRGALLSRAAETRFPLLAANLHLADQPPGSALSWPGISPSVLLERDEILIGIVGVTTASTLRTTNIANVNDLAIEPLASAIEREARLLQSRGAQVIIVAAHAGGECTAFDDPQDLASCDQDSEIFAVARALPTGLVDVILAGHTHKSLAHEVNGIAIVSAWSRGRGFGRVELTVEGEDTLHYIFPPTELCTPNEDDGESASLCALDGRPVEEVAAVRQAVTPALEAAASRLNETLGPVLDAPFERAYDHESAAGSLLTTGIAAVRPGADGVLLNAGGVRASFPAGPLTYGALYEVFPFDNLFATVTLTAEQLVAILANNAAAHGGALLLGKLRAEFSCRDSLSGRLLDERGRTIPNDREVTLVTSDYLATTSAFSILPEGAVEIDFTGPLMREALADWMRTLDGQHLSPDQFYDRDAVRVELPMPRPVHCPSVQ